VLLGFNSCRPSSRGALHIVSSDPACHPATAPNYLATEHDIAEARAGIALMRKLAAAKPLASVITEELVPGPGVQGEAALLEDFRQRADTVFHPTSTCMMGPDPTSSVVDPRLKVHGVEGLRVIDASIFPTITSGNTNAPTVMVGEKGAAMVLEDLR
jgi:choline dehydrogenase